MTGRGLLVVQAAARGLGLRWVGYVVVAWLGLAAFAAVTLPLKFPFQARDEMVDNGVVVGLVLPLAVMSRLLDEGAPHLVAGASRTLAAVRCGWAAAFLAANCVGAVVGWAVAPVPFDLFISDALFLGASTVLGVGVLGSRLGWLVPLVITFVASGPNLIPWEANLLYREETASTLLPIAAALWCLALVAYARNGGYGLFTARALRRADATLTHD